MSRKKCPTLSNLRPTSVPSDPNPSLGCPTCPTYFYTKSSFSKNGDMEGNRGSWGRFWKLL